MCVCVNLYDIIYYRRNEELDDKVIIRKLKERVQELEEEVKLLKNDRHVSVKCNTELLLVLLILLFSVQYLNLMKKIRNFVIKYFMIFYMVKYRIQLVKVLNIYMIINIMVCYL